MFHSILGFGNDRRLEFAFLTDNDTRRWFSRDIWCVDVVAIVGNRRMVFGQQDDPTGL